MAQKKTAQKEADRIQPLGARVLVEPFEEDQLKSGNTAGIIMPDTAEQEKPQQGMVVAVGEGVRDENGAIIPMQVQEGDTVIFSKFGYDTVTISDSEYYILKEENILAIIT